MSLIDLVSQTITHRLTVDLSDHIADHFGLDPNEVSLSVKSYLGYNSTPIVASNTGVVHKKSPPTKSAITGVNLCKFVITSGDNKGKACCTAIRGMGNYCSKHKNRKIAIAERNGKSVSITFNTQIKCWVVKGTKYAIKSSQNKTIIGKIIGKKITKLTKDDYKKVLKYNLPTSDEDEDDEESEKDEDEDTEESEKDEDEDEDTEESEKDEDEDTEESEKDEYDYDTEESEKDGG